MNQIYYEWDLPGLKGQNDHAETPAPKPSKKTSPVSSDTRRKRETAAATATMGAAPELWTTSKDLLRVTRVLAASEAPIALDIETYGENTLDPWRGDIRILSLAVPGHPPWLLDLKALGYDLGALKSILEQHPVIGHRVKFDTLWLAQKCGVRIRETFCTCTAARLLTAGTREPNDLGECLRRYLNLELPKDQSRSDWGSLFLSPEQLHYSSQDVAHLHELTQKLRQELEQAQLAPIAQLEMELLPVVVKMELDGIEVDRAKLQQLYGKMQAEADQVAVELNQAFGVAVNLNSPQQLQQALARHGVSLPDTREATLAASNHPLVAGLLRYRAAKKLVEQAEALLAAVQSDNRIHALFEPTGTTTGRFSSNNPNLQNIARGELRTCFIAPPGHALIVADYSQIELRAAAVIAQETKMIEAFKRGEDLHKKTASLVLEKPIAAVTPEDRRLAKAVNFGLLYGQSPRGLVNYAKTHYGIDLSEEQAATIRGRFFQAYAGLKSWHNRAWHDARAGVNEVRTLLKRRRWLPQDTEQDWRRFTGLVNTVVQGSCADVMKQALVGLAKQLPDGAKIVSTVHDELLVETPQEHSEQVKQLVQDNMIQPMVAMFPQVPIEVEVKVCQHWGEK